MSSFPWSHTKHKEEACFLSTEAYQLQKHILLIIKDILFDIVLNNIKVSLTVVS